jgi:hypothetical protein
MNFNKNVQTRFWCMLETNHMGKRGGFQKVTKFGTERKWHLAAKVVVHKPKLY